MYSLGIIIPQSSSSNRKRNSQELFTTAIQQNLFRITAFLDTTSINNFKLTCRMVNYIFISQEIWQGMKFQVGEKKIEFYDDVDFVQQEPKTINKEDRKIRIHSLKKSVNHNIKKRQPSNIKNKMINALDQQMPFGKTEVGFRRLLKTNHSKQRLVQVNQSTNILSLVQISQNLQIKDIVINVQDPWSINMQKASKLTSIIKKWNQFHSKFRTSFAIKQSNFSKQNKLYKENLQILIAYQKLFCQEPYTIIQNYVEGAQKNLLIDEQLNKVSKLFLKFHRQSLSMSKQLDKLVQKCEKVVISIDTITRKQFQLHQSVEKSSLQKIETASLAEILNAIDEEIQNFDISTYKVTAHFVISNIVDGFDSLLDSQFTSQIHKTMLRKISISDICRDYQHYQLVFQILSTCYSKLFKMATYFGEDYLTLSLSASKFKNMKSITNNLWNISKYFTKLQKQIQNKKVNEKANIIKQFLDFYCKYTCQFQIMNYKNAARVQKQMLFFKEKIKQLKEKMQNKQ